MTQPTGQPWLIQTAFTLVKFFSNVLKSIWLFFPAILFILLTFACFIKLGQGKDIIISFTENTRSGIGAADVFINVLIKLTFFVAIAFWVYVSWYSSRIVAYAKLYRQKTYANQFKPTLPEDQFGTRYEVQPLFLDSFPRLVGYACFIIVLFAVSNMIFPNSWLKKQPILFLAIFLLAAGLLDKRLIRFTDNELNSKRLRRWFVIVGIAFLGLLLVLQVSGFLNSPYVLFSMILLMMVLYTLYINLRRKKVDEDAPKKMAAMAGRQNVVIALLKKTMTFIHLEHKEVGYFLWFNIICGFGLVAYLSAIIWFRVSVAFGPMPLVLLAFAVLLGFGNMLTTLSVKTGLNLHFIIFLIAALFTTPENHFVRMASMHDRKVDAAVFQKRQHIQQYLSAWVSHHAAIDSVPEYPVYFVLGNGGASRSAYWVASVLGRLEDSSLRSGKERFSDHVFCLSGTSGGGVGVAAFYALLKNADKKDRTPAFEISAKDFLRQDFLTYTLARMLGPDYFNFIPVVNWFLPNRDRVDALETAFEKAADTAHYKLHFNNTYFDECIAEEGVYNGLPILCINTTRVQDGSPGVVCSIQLDAKLFDKRVDVVSLLPPDTTIRLSTAAILGARFPYMSPAGRIDQPTSAGSRKHYFVDGGYFDNSGAGVVQEMIRAIIMASDTTTNQLLRKRMQKLKIVVLHITNSPQGDTHIKPITPFKNDLTSPLLTILGAYDMQTTVNDMRLASYITDINQRPDSAGLSKAIYYPIHLYNDPEERGDTNSNGPYAMNWFISDSVRNEMDRRLLK
ncbi:MAG: hypothetical protein ABI813_13600, partial [Bacteroidota bacterium]